MYYIVYRHIDGTAVSKDTARIIEAEGDAAANKVVRALQHEETLASLKPYKRGTKPPAPAYIARFDRGFFTRGEATAEMRGAFSNV
jgi:hypothetical protein